MRELNTSPLSSEPLGDQVLQIPLSDRWRIHHRLQELKIKSYCPPDGSLRVQVNNLLEVILIRSTVMQFLASRQELLEWLERCWHYNDEK
ncbi:Asr1405/Asl0597 family protein [uncultured Nostoc sp.]|uniref:Asr1405/Asl0597 family protein n=1 Tax=uncultured Nostoc sp. TaxID=340711 RepID=UPI0035CC19A4